MNEKITTDIISTTGINISKYNILPSKVFINNVEITDTESWNKAISTFSELQDKINNLQSKIDKAIEFINSQKTTVSKLQADLFNEDRDNKSKLKVGTFMWNVDELLDILKEDK